MGCRFRVSELQPACRPSPGGLVLYGPEPRIVFTFLKLKNRGEEGSEVLAAGTLGGPKASRSYPGPFQKRLANPWWKWINHFLPSQNQLKWHWTDSIFLSVLVTIPVSSLSAMTDAGTWEHHIAHHVHLVNQMLSALTWASLIQVMTCWLATIRFSIFSLLREPPS